MWHVPLGASVSLFGKQGFLTSPTGSYELEPKFECDLIILVVTSRDWDAGTARSLSLPPPPRMARFRSKDLSRVSQS